MSKAFAYATSMGGEVYFTKASDKNTVDWFDDQGHVNMPLYTTDHAEELAKALEELMSIVTIHQKATGNNFAWAEIDCAQEALTNYREATE